MPLTTLLTSRSLVTLPLISFSLVTIVGARTDVSIAWLPSGVVVRVVAFVVATLMRARCMVTVCSAKVVAVIGASVIGVIVVIMIVVV